MKTFFKKFLSLGGRLLRHTPLAKSEMLNNMHGWLSLWLHGSDTVNIGPFIVKFDRRDHVIAKKLVLYKQFEDKEIELLCSLVGAGSHVLDIGANIGLHSLYLSHAVGPKGRIISVEPDPDNLKILRDNIEANQCRNVTVLPYAFGIESGEVNLYQNETNRGNLSLVNVAESTQSVKVEMCRGEDVLVDLKVSPSLAKIDVEGFEPFVIKGLGAYKPDHLFFEFFIPYLEKAQVDPEAFLVSLTQEGYCLSLIDSDGKVLKMTPTELTNYSRKHWKPSNILATR